MNRYKDGHIRHAAFHGILFIFFLVDRVVPEYLRKMAAKINTEVAVTGITRKEAISRALAIGASLAHGVVPVS